MIVNFRARGISQGARKLARIPILNKKKKTLGERFIKSLRSVGFFSLYNICVCLYIYIYIFQFIHGETPDRGARHPNNLSRPTCISKNLQKKEKLYP